MSKADRPVPAWASLPAAQQPEWPDPHQLAQASAQLSTQPGLVSAQASHQLREELAHVAAGQAFFLHGGDCAELFSEVNPHVIRAKLCTLLQMALVLTYAGGLPVVKVGRMAGQYAKPRTHAEETRAGLALPAYRGDMVNDQPFTVAARTPNPQRLLQAYHAAQHTLQLVATLLGQGLADLNQVHQWNAGFVRGSPAMAAYERMATDIERALAFMRACRVSSPQFHQTQVYASHEALILDYEQALVRPDGDSGASYASSGHLLWVGERTRQPAGAHLGFTASITNPVGVKLGPTTTPEQVVQLCHQLNPQAVPGRLSLITRLGSGCVTTALPPLIEAVQASAVPVVWVCDPMHANTFTTDSGRKTRRFDDVVAEVAGFFSVHRQLGSWPGGISVELTGSDVTECLGGSQTVSEHDLDRRYETACDPRLNHSQALELAFLVADMMQASATDSRVSL